MIDLWKWWIWIDGEYGFQRESVSKGERERKRVFMFMFMWWVFACVLCEYVCVIKVLQMDMVTTYTIQNRRHKFTSIISGLEVIQKSDKIRHFLV